MPLFPAKWVTLLCGMDEQSSRYWRTAATADIRSERERESDHESHRVGICVDRHVRVRRQLRLGGRERKTRVHDEAACLLSRSPSRSLRNTFALALSLAHPK